MVIAVQFDLFSTFYNINSGIVTHRAFKFKQKTFFRVNVSVLSVVFLIELKHIFNCLHLKSIESIITLHCTTLTCLLIV